MTSSNSKRLVGVAAIAAIAAGTLTIVSPARAATASKPWKVGVSNTLVGNGWREEMICAVKAEVAARTGGKGSVVVANRNGGPTEQANDLKKLISSGVNAIVVNPSDPEKLNTVIKQAAAKGIVVIAVDSSVTAPEAYNASNDQVAYGQLGGEWLFKAIGGKGNVVEMRGIEGVPADTDRHTGFMAALKKYPNVKVVKEVFTGWDFTKGGQATLDILNSGLKVDGIWTSGIDITVAKAFETAKKPLVPIVGADNNGFINLILTKGVPGAAVTNPAVIGGVGASLAMDVLEGKTVAKTTKLTPQVWDLASSKAQLTANYFPKRDDFFSAAVSVKPFTSYTNDQLFACK